MDKSAKLKPHVPPDIVITNHGSIMLMRSHTERAMEWVAENVEVQQLFGPSVVVEWRYAGGIAKAAREAGLEVHVKQGEAGQRNIA